MESRRKMIFRTSDFIQIRRNMGGKPKELFSQTKYLTPKYMSSRLKEKKEYERIKILSECYIASNNHQY